MSVIFVDPKYDTHDAYTKHYVKLAEKGRYVYEGDPHLALYYRSKRPAFLIVKAGPRYHNIGERQVLARWYVHFWQRVDDVAIRAAEAFERWGLAGELQPEAERIKGLVTAYLST